jgi:hypothetical protein
VSALPPKADISWRNSNARFVPKTNIASEMKEAPTEGGLIEVHYSPFRNIAHRTFPSALINIGPRRGDARDPHWRPAIRASRALDRFEAWWCRLKQRHSAFPFP